MPPPPPPPPNIYPNTAKYCNSKISSLQHIIIMDLVYKCKKLMLCMIYSQSAAYLISGLRSYVYGILYHSNTVHSFSSCMQENPIQLCSLLHPSQPLRLTLLCLPCVCGRSGACTNLRRESNIHKIILRIYL